MTKSRYKWILILLCFQNLKKNNKMACLWPYRVSFLSFYFAVFAFFIQATASEPQSEPWD